MSKYTQFNSARWSKVGGDLFLLFNVNLNSLLKKAEVTDDIVGIKEKLRKKTVKLVYRAPAQTPDIEERFYDQLVEVCNEHDSIKMEEFNFPTSKWNPFLVAPDVDAT